MGLNVLTFYTSKETDDNQQTVFLQNDILDCFFFLNWSTICFHSARDLDKDITTPQCLLKQAV